MLSKAQEKYIRSLKSKKKRYELKRFIIEGEKLIEEALQEGVELESVFVSESKKEDYQLIFQDIDIIKISDREMKNISQMETAPGILAIVKMPDLKASRSDLILAIEKMNDPGNFGTMIRTAECFGVDEIWCSNDSVDPFNFKTVQASMGSIFRVPIQRFNLIEKLERVKMNTYVSHLNGENVYQCEFQSPLVLVIGSESHGVSKEMENLATQKIKIPQKGKVESLNAAMACGILLAEINRQFAG